MIRARELRKAYGERVAVDGLGFEIAEGETLGLLGPNGAGKTTTIQLLVGALRPDAGGVEIGGETDPTRPAVRAKLGVAPQALAIYDELSADENLRFFGTLYGLSGPRLAERVDAALAFAGLTDRRRDRVRTFSGGMQRRLNMACAIVHDPPVLLFDEPTVGVDPQSRNHIFDAIAALKRQRRTILYTTHYMEEAARLCDRVAILDRGRLLAAGTVEALIGEHGGPAVVDAEIGGESILRQTEAPLEEIARLAADAAARGAVLSRLRLDRPDLERVFLKLTGRSLRD